MNDDSRQGQIVSGLITAGKAGWASRAGSDSARLVEAASGETILGFDSSPVTRGRPVSDPEVDLPWDKFLPLLADLEGYFPYMYLDINHFVTVAIGQMMPDAEAAVTLNRGDLPFYEKAGGARASDDAVRAEFARVKALTDLADRGARAYKDLTTLAVHEDDAEALLKTEAEDHLDELVRTGKYPDFETYPAGVQMALADMAFNLGIPKFIRQFVNFRAAVLNRDWKRAKTESHRRDLGRRNTIVGSWFDDAIESQRFYILTPPSGTSEAPRKILTQDGGLAPA